MVENFIVEWFTTRPTSKTGNSDYVTIVLRIMKKWSIMSVNNNY